MEKIETWIKSLEDFKKNQKLLKSCIKLRQDVKSSEVEKAWKNLWKIETSWEKILQAQAAIWSLYHILTQDIKVSWVWLLQISKNKTKNIERELH